MIKTIAVLEGDGIGPEITREDLKVLDAVAEKFNHKFIYKKAPFGVESYFKFGNSFPEGTKTICDESNVIIKVPVGLISR